MSKLERTLYLYTLPPMYVVHIIYAKDYIHIWGHTNLWLYQ